MELASRAPQCSAHAHGGKRCRKVGLLRDDGTYTTNCRFHGGLQQRAPEGDPIRGGRPPTTFRYSRFMRTEEEREMYESARGLLGSLDEELCLARVNLERFRKKVGENERGGIPLGIGAGGKSVSIRPYAEIEAQYLSLIARLESRRATVIATLAEVGGGGGTGDATEDYAAWIRGVRSRRES